MCAHVGPVTRVVCSSLVIASADFSVELYVLIQIKGLHRGLSVVMMHDAYWRAMGTQVLNTQKRCCPPMIEVVLEYLTTVK
jgi:hypothetical protein